MGVRLIIPMGRCDRGPRATLETACSGQVNNVTHSQWSYASQKALTVCPAFKHTNVPEFSHQLQGCPWLLDLFSHMWC